MTATTPSKGKRPAKPRGRYVKRISAPHAPGLAPYELPRVSGDGDVVRLNAVSRSHGGYGVLYDGYIHGPFFVYENAVDAGGPLPNSRVVRWVDFMDQSSATPGFLTQLSKLERPLTCPVYGIRQLAPVVWPTK